MQAAAGEARPAPAGARLGCASDLYLDGAGGSAGGINLAGRR